MKRFSRSLFCLALGVGSLLSNSVRAQPRPVASTVLPAASAAPIVPPPATRQPPPVNPFGAPPQPALQNYITFDAEQKAVSVTNGTPAAHFTFSLTNISSGDVTINFVRPSCGCTVAQLPSNPWKLTPKESGEFSATMQLAGTPPGGTKIKTLTVETDKGSQVLYVRATVLPSAPTMTGMDRTNAQKIALADRQAVFKGDCATCHVAPAKDARGNDKMGHDLFVAVCGVCHESEHRATFVPDLHRLPEPTSQDFWRNWIMHGKPGTLMPAFARSEGGILNDAQIESLVLYLTATIPPHPVTIISPNGLQAR